MARGTRIKKAPVKPSSKTGAITATHCLLTYRMIIKRLPIGIFSDLNNFSENVQLVVLQFRLNNLIWKQ